MSAITLLEKKLNDSLYVTKAASIVIGNVLLWYFVKKKDYY